MKPILDPHLEAYARAHSCAPSALLRELEDYTRAQRPDAQMLIGAHEAALLKLLLRLIGARRVLEIGTFTGYSALAMAEALPEDGEILTCDINPETCAIAQSFFARSPHGGKIRIRLGPALETLERLDGEFDLAFLDADKETYPVYYERLLARVCAGGLIVADNVLWSGRVLAPQRESDRALVAFNARVQQDARVENVLLPVRDGVMVIRKR